MKEQALERELRIRKKWQKEQTFQQSIENRQGSPTFVFYEGPPTANGLPHAGHALGRTIKDFVARYKTMSGYQVIRKAGWDTHGLPVELEVEKQLKIRGKDEIEAYGVERFIEQCKKSVFTYEQQWKQFTEALGYWVDMDHPYVTLTNKYIESVWHILASIHGKGYLYRGHRVVPYCPHCETSLSSHEVAQGYKDVIDLSVTAKFKLEGTNNTYLLGWTTTPWTLPGNVAVAVHPDMTYVKVEQGNQFYIIAESRVSAVMNGEYRIDQRLKGTDLIGLSYQAPFDYFDIKHGHQVVGADFVTDTSGTGLVHIAPAHGDDDYQVAMNHQFDFINAVDRKGCYKPEVTPLAGQFVKNCDVEIIKMLAERGRLFDKEKYQHSYPHCWRCDTPLLYYAMGGWFIKTTAIKDQIQANNQQVEWFPDHIKEGRFGNFLENMVDWNIGRNRYWGTPLNVWICQQCGQEKAPNSIQQMREWATHEVSEQIELHKPYVDQVELSCRCGGTMRRTSEVIDVWFDSGSMPFAQYHYPFENQERFQQQFPADVVIEGIDQTRGWFYSLLAVSTLFTGEKPYKRVLSLGHILDEHGQKMSKSKGNALSPTELIEEFGADALRWALLSDSSPWHNKRFSKKTVSHAQSKLIDTLVNVYQFYAMYAKIDQFDPSTDLGGTRSRLDDWVLSRLNTVNQQVVDSLEHYDLTKGARVMATFLDQLSNWYVRRSRQRFWSSGMSEDKRAAFTTLYQVLIKLNQLMAPYIPFVTEDIFSQLTGTSVHLSDYPKPDVTLINQELEQEMDTVLQLIELARSARNAASIKTKQPLAELTVVPKASIDPIVIEKFHTIIKEEINVKSVVFKEDAEPFIQFDISLNFPVAGPKLGKAIGEVKQRLTELNQAEQQQLVANQQLELKLQSGHLVTLMSEDVQITKQACPGYQLAENNDLIVLLNIELTTELKQEGLVREFIRVVQTQRKKLALPVELKVDLYVHAEPEFQDILQTFKALLEQNLVLNTIYFVEASAEQEQIKIEPYQVGLFIAV